MDDLMNKVSALIEAHVKSEVEARDSLATRASFTAQFNIIRDERDTVVQQFEWMREERDAANRSANKYRVMWEQLHRAQSEEVGAAGQLKELLSALGLAHFDRSTIEGALKATRERDKRLVAERDEACAAKDKAVRDLQEMREKVQALELKLLEVRKAAADEPAPLEADGFRVGDLVRGVEVTQKVGEWGTVARVDRFIEVKYKGRVQTVAHYRDEVVRKPIEVGDRVRIVGGNPSHIGSTFVVRRMSNNGLAVGDLGSWSLHNIVAVAP